MLTFGAASPTANFKPTTTGVRFGMAKNENAQFFF
jgi:hypothetical protein